jgi:hypothetical protein
MRKSSIAAVAVVVAVGAVSQAPAQPRRPTPAAPAAPARAPAQVVTGPVSTYWMSAETTAGFGAGMAGGGGGQPSLGSIMGMMRGGGAAANHKLTLQLGSSTAATSPSADHTMPAGFGVGPKLPLLTPRTAPPAPVETGDTVPREFQRPRGRMLIFWGCGDRARPGQPLVLDFAQMADGKMPAAAMGAMRGLNYTPMQPPSSARSRTYGDWPNERDRAPPPTSSLVGPHAVAGNYTSPINFALTPTQDFMPALGLRTATTPAGSAQLTWTAAPTARGYLAMAIGAGTQDTVALWISSEGQAAAFGLPDYLSPADLQRLVAAKALMPAGSTTCTAPKEFVDVAPTAFVNLAGYGEEANFSSPPRPADPRTPWNIDWAVKVRYRTAESAILGMDMAAMGGGGAAPPPSARGFPGQPAQSAPGFPGQPAQTAPPPQTPGDSARDAVIRGLGSAIGRGLLGGR